MKWYLVWFPLAEGKFGFSLQLSRVPLFPWRLIDCTSLVLWQHGGRDRADHELVRFSLLISLMLSVVSGFICLSEGDQSYSAWLTEAVYYTTSMNRHETDTWSLMMGWITKRKVTTIGKSAFVPGMGIPWAERLARYFRLYSISERCCLEHKMKKLQE